MPQIVKVSDDPMCRTCDNFNYQKLACELAYTCTQGDAWIERRASQKQQHDNVEHPKHYTQGVFETIDVIQDTLSPEMFEGFCLGNAIKYVSRARFKGGQEDIEKAVWYLKKWLSVKKREVKQ
jgi:hypothetical protein